MRNEFNKVLLVFGLMLLLPFGALARNTVSYSVSVSVGYHHYYTYPSFSPPIVIERRVYYYDNLDYYRYQHYYYRYHSPYYNRYDCHRPYYQYSR